MNIDLNALKNISALHGIPVDDLLRTIAEALLASYREYRELPAEAAGEGSEGERARVEIDTDTGDVAVLVSERDEDGAVISERDDTPVNFSRIGAPAVLGAIKRRVRQAEAGRVFSEYSGFEGQVVSGVVQRDAPAEARGLVVVQLGTEADPQDGIVLPAEQIPGEKLSHGDRIKAFVVGVNRGERSVQINLSRTHPELVRGLFALEVPEVADGTVEIVSIAREAGHRSKVAVRATVKGVNAKGACIGPRGARVSNIMSQLGGEKIDIIDYSDDPARYVGNSLAPSKVVRVDVLDREAQSARVIVPDYQLSLAIGKEGQNARLAARLTGWKIDIHSDADPIEAE
ncbi:transcription termination factor NusA [Corynebacterium liangguodongii]|uniref:Transcription termination/antitermination protein NusA n=1 Tax=Corynebacterium liangguodongii TaxID=2079535 RepID=A0A2S0WEP1_9CORY|nr:transcription termination factor NusA [Corynebacterium liangguodongii]AWB84226.1 transcription termination/antitermination protein NusA [Corynebacterium liangguodongii]PWC00235.1 transcription termination/antitermination protein NusA [Corynebacterium liangguodongii]